MQNDMPENKKLPQDDADAAVETVEDEPAAGGDAPQAEDAAGEPGTADAADVSDTVKADGEPADYAGEGEGEGAVGAADGEALAPPSPATIPAAPATPGAPEAPAAPVAPVPLAPATAAKAAPATSGMPAAAWIAIAIGACVVGLLIGMFVLGGRSFGGPGAGGAGIGTATLTESQLDQVVASYTFGGKTQDVTAREVIVSTSGTIQAAADQSGNYATPAADAILNYARNRVMLAEAQNRGFTASDEDVNAYAEQSFGSSDLATTAQMYGMDESTLRTAIAESCTIENLRNSIVDMPDQSAMPQEPTAPAEGAEEQPTKEYADYIIALVGDEWDSAKGTWASTDGMYAQALAKHQITPEGATYAAAQEAYYTAYQQYSEASQAVQSTWTDFLNSVLDSASISVYTLGA